MSIKIYQSILIKCALIGIIFSGHGTALANSQDQFEKLKVAFLYQFTSYIHWKNEKNPSKFNICFYESSALKEKFIRAVKSSNLPVKVCDSWNIDKISDQHIIYLGKFDKNIVKIAQKNSILTISHGVGYAKKGVAINFFNTIDMLRFEINPGVLEESNLRLSSQVMKLGVIVE